MVDYILQNSARVIRSSVFGFDEKDKVRELFRFNQNNLIITSIDIQSVEPVDQRTRDSLQKSVQLAIEITTNSQEAAARYVLPDKQCLLGVRPYYLVSLNSLCMQYTSKTFKTHCP